MFLDAHVSMPITSSHLWNAQGFRSTLEAGWGETVKKDTGETDPLIVRNGVYFIKMYVKKHIVEGAPGPSPSAPASPPPVPAAPREPRPTKSILKRPQPFVRPVA